MRTAAIAIISALALAACDAGANGAPDAHPFYPPCPQVCPGETITPVQYEGWAMQCMPSGQFCAHGYDCSQVCSPTSGNTLTCTSEPYGPDDGNCTCTAPTGYAAACYKTSSYPN